jgi:hypothetical protein
LFIQHSKKIQNLQFIILPIQKVRLTAHLMKLFQEFRKNLSMILLISKYVTELRCIIKKLNVILSKLQIFIFAVNYKPRINNIFQDHLNVTNIQSNIYFATNIQTRSKKLYNSTAQITLKIFYLQTIEFI